MCSMTFNDVNVCRRMATVLPNIAQPVKEMPETEPSKTAQPVTEPPDTEPLKTAQPVTELPNIEPSKMVWVVDGAGWCGWWCG